MMYIFAAHFPLNNKKDKNDSSEKTTVKKASDHSYLDMFA